MPKYAYPAIFRHKDNTYYVSFPDIENCFTDGNSLAEAIESAEDVLALMLCEYEDEDNLPEATDIKTLKVSENETASLVFCDTTEYRKANDNRAIKKTLTIPAWLNTKAEKAGINFSQTLQEALTNKLYDDVLRQNKMHK